MIKFLCSKYFDYKGWKFVDKTPKDLRKFVILGCPHTSNWDFWLAMTFFYKSNIAGKFTIKKQWLRFPFKTLFTKMGAIGIDRETISKGNHQNLTEYMASLIREADDFAMLMAPEGTRKPVTKWKTGFYYTAVKAGVPIVLAYGDYVKKELGMGLVLYPTNYEDDMKQIMDFYSKITPQNPNNFAIDSRFK